MDKLKELLSKNCELTIMLNDGTYHLRVTFKEDGELFAFTVCNRELRKVIAGALSKINNFPNEKFLYLEERRKMVS